MFCVLLICFTLQNRIENERKKKQKNARQSTRHRQSLFTVKTKKKKKKLRKKKQKIILEVSKEQTRHITNEDFFVFGFYFLTRNVKFCLFF